MFAGLAMALGSAALSYEGGKERNDSHDDRRYYSYQPEKPSEHY